MLKRYVLMVMVAVLAGMMPKGPAEGGEKLVLCGKNGVLIDEAAKQFSIVQKDVSKPVSYNDMGCAVLWRDDQCTAIQATFDNTARVYDYFSGEELLMRSALFVTGSGIETPMGFGIAAFQSREEAERFIGERGRGKVVTYDELLLMRLE